MTKELFDRRLRQLRRDRAARQGPALFLQERAFAECLDRLRDVARNFDQALLLGCPAPDWRDRLGAVAARVTVADPGPAFAARAGGTIVEEDRTDFGEGRFDLIVAVGTLDTVNNLPAALMLLGRALKPGGLLIGAMAGGDSLPALRAALIESGRADGRIVARTHPRINAAQLAGLLTAAGLSLPVVDIDRVSIRYATLDALAHDLRAMGATSVLHEPRHSLTKSTWKFAADAFAAMRGSGKTSEQVEILHFLGWAEQSTLAAG
ncbi:methyltransferase domain-containing protein [Sphingomonas xanthus]|uniref:methyltransferase domain-containing protein n=1 Tax=Sphingomonas xanthus TaxID=2594473 RepID=UPI00164E4E69|nr:methyltransferase domain-containing protein [Sphingomonas xanthus]